MEGWLEVARGEILGLVQDGEKQNHHHYSLYICLSTVLNSIVLVL